VATTTFPCYLVQDDDGRPSGRVAQITLDDLPKGEVLIEVEYSSLNYKDALAATGHRGVVARLPHVPGIDAAGVVVESTSDRFTTGQRVLVTGYDFGAGHWGGYSRYARVPADWVVPLPAGLSAEESMILGTAGFTAAQSVQALVKHGVTPESGDVVVTGATGGVGCLAVAMLARLGYRVTAVTGKTGEHPFLRSLGAADVVDRAAVDDDGDRPLLATRWAGAIDTVGGRILTTLLRSTAHRGCVTACGLVAGTDLNLTVYPFILRGVTLVGVDSAMCPMDARLEIWSKLAGEWKPADLGEIATTITLSELDRAVGDILAGKIRGRTLVRPTTDSVSRSA
jgi:putative YhdH/YhfP family quinone oxidoreductase